MAIRVDTGLGLAQFENANELRMYPFSDTASLVGKNGLELPRDVIVDLHMSVPSEGEPEVRLSGVHLSQSMVSACFMSKYSNKVSALSVTVARSSFKPYFPYRLEKLAGSEDIGGVVSFGEITFPGYPVSYLMDAKIHPCCIISSKPASLRKITDLRSGLSVSGDVQIDFSDYVESSRNGNIFSLALEEGAEQILASSVCDGTSGGVCGATPIRTINGVSPDDDGNIVLWFH